MCYLQHHRQFFFEKAPTPKGTKNNLYRYNIV
jgi:hypothetical protein